MNSSKFYFSIPLLLLGDAVDVSAVEQNLAGGDSDDPSVWQQVLERFQRWASSHASLLAISATRICDGSVWRALEYWSALTPMVSASN